jgi:hypothetical protein
MSAGNASSPSFDGGGGRADGVGGATFLRRDAVLVSVVGRDGDRGRGDGDLRFISVLGLEWPDDDDDDDKGRRDVGDLLSSPPPPSLANFW